MRCAHDAPTDVLTDAYREANTTTICCASPAAKPTRRWRGWSSANRRLPTGCRTGRALPALARRHAPPGTHQRLLPGRRQSAAELLLRPAEQLGIRCSTTPRSRTDPRSWPLRSGRMRSKANARGCRANALVVASGGFESNLEWMKPGARPPTTSSSAARRTTRAACCGCCSIRARRDRRSDAVSRRRDRRPRAEIRRRHRHAPRLRAARHRRQPGRQRFYDEGEDLWPKRYAIWGRLVAQQPDQIAYSIIDSKALGMFMPSVFPPIDAKTIAELASALGLPAEKLESTVANSTPRCAPAHFDHHRFWTTAAPKGSRPPNPTGRGHRPAAVLRLSAAARHHVHVSWRQGQ